MPDREESNEGRGGAALEPSPELRAARLRAHQRLAQWRGELREHVHDLDTHLERAGVSGEAVSSALPSVEAPREPLPVPPSEASTAALPPVAAPPAAAARERPPAEVVSPRGAREREAAPPLALAIPAGAVLALVVAAAYVWLAVSDGGYAPSVYSAAGLVVWWAAVLALVLRVWPRGGLPRATAAAAFLLAAFSILAVLSTAWASDGGRAFTEGARAVGYLGVFVLAAIVARSGGARQMLGGIAIGLVVLAGLSLSSRLQPGLVGNEAELQRLLPETAGRLSYPIGYWNGLASCMALAICALSWLGADARSRLARALAVAALPLPVLVIYLSGSRGGMLAAAAGLAALLVLAPQRWRTLAVVALGSAGGAVLVVLASHQSDLVHGLDSSAAASAGDRLTIACVAAAAILALIAYRGDGFLERVSPRRLGVPAPLAAGIIVVAVLALNIVVQPGEQLKEARSAPTTSADVQPVETGNVPLGTSSGRIEYWQSAIDAFRDKPVVGLGAGEFATWWTEHGSLAQPVTNAHSLFVESLAELGIVGAALIAGFFLVPAIAGLRRGLAARRLDARAPAVGVAAAALAMLVAGAASAAGDWTWELPAAFAPVVVAAAVLTTPEAAERDRRATRGGAVRLGIVLAVCAAAIAAVGAVYLTELRLDQSREAVTSSDLDQAADRARDASNLQPFSAEPYTQLALVERAQGRDVAARDAIDEAIQRSPDDWRLWFLAAHIDYELGDYVAERRSLARARELAPRAPASLFIAPGPRAPASPPPATSEP